MQKKEMWLAKEEDKSKQLQKEQEKENWTLPKKMLQYCDYDAAILY